MTKEQIENLSADRETDALIAVEFFGWRWLSSKKNEKKLSACFPPDSGYEMIPEDWDPSDTSGERFADWDKIRWLNKDGQIVTGFLHYSTDIKPAWTIVKEIATQTRTYHVAWYGGQRGACANFTGQISGECYASLSECDGDFEKAQCLAICRAALLWKLSQEQDDDQDTSRKRGEIADC